jgi:PAS domain S-box-containing protein
MQSTISGGNESDWTANGYCCDAALLLKRLQIIVNRSPAVVFLWRCAPEVWPVDYVSENITQFGYTPDDFISGRVSWPGITHPDDLARLESEVAGYLKAGQYEFSQQYRLLTKDGEERWVEDWNLALCGAGGQITHVQGFILDITERRRLALEVMEVAQREQMCIGAALHDGIGQELTGVAFLVKALEAQLPPNQPDALKLIKQIGSLINGVLQQTRKIAVGLSPVDPGAEGLATALQRVVQSASELYTARCRCRIQGDGLIKNQHAASHLYYIANEAVGNAARHSGARTISVCLKTDGTNAELSVEDDGQWCANKSSREAGMGLRLMEHRAELIGGKLTRSQTPGGGTRISCSFPNC